MKTLPRQATALVPVASTCAQKTVRRAQKTVQNRNSTAFSVAEKCPNIDKMVTLRTGVKIDTNANAAPTPHDLGRQPPQDTC